MKQAWMFSDNADLVARVKANYLIELNILGLIANKAAYAEGEDWLNQLVEYIDGNQTFAADFIAAKIPLIKHVKPQGTYLAWLDVTAVAERIGAKKLADEANRDRARGHGTRDTRTDGRTLFRPRTPRCSSIRARCTAPAARITCA